jgi:hypothetical protein
MAKKTDDDIRKEIRESLPPDLLKLYELGKALDDISPTSEEGKRRMKAKAMLQSQTDELNDQFRQGMTVQQLTHRVAKDSKLPKTGRLYKKEDLTSPKAYYVNYLLYFCIAVGNRQVHVQVKYNDCMGGMWEDHVIGFCDGNCKKGEETELFASTAQAAVNYAGG